MNFKTRLMFAAFGLVAAFLYSTFISEPARKKLEAKLQHATTNEVVALLGQPYRAVAATNFTTRAMQMENEGYPICTADMHAKGNVWMYGDGEPERTGSYKYQTIFFDQSNRVYAVYNTYWTRDLLAKQ
jgi:hypothetical protein